MTTMTNPTFVQSAFRGRSGDTVTLNDNTTWAAALNTNWSQMVDATFRVRFEVEETATANQNNTLSPQLEYNLNGAGWNAVNASSNVVRAVASGQFNEGDATTNILSSSALGFLASTGSEDGLAGSVTLSNQQTEAEFAIQIRSVDVSNNDSIQLRISNAGTALNTYSQTPTVTAKGPVAVAQVTETDAAQAITASKWVTLGQVSETDAAQGITVVQAAEKLRITWAQLQVPGIADHIVALGQVTETDAAQAITVSGLKIVALGQASETDSAQAVASMQLEDNYERSCVDLSGSSITGTGDSALVVIQPRVQESEVWSGNRWIEPGARVRGVKGFRPTFRFTQYASGVYHGYPWQSTRRPMFSYDRETWTYFDTAVTIVDGSYVEFRHSTAFTSNVVYITRDRQISVDQTGAWLEGLQSANPTKIGPSAAAQSFTPTLTSWSGQSFIADEFSSQTNELGATIPATPFYAALIDDTSLSPSNGEPKKLALIVSGVHAGEDLGNWVCKVFIERLLGSGTAAQNLRRNYKFLLYPMLNAPGRAGGGHRGSFTQGSGGADDANRHFSSTTTTLEIIDKPKAVMNSDRGSTVPAVMIDFHAMFADTWGLDVDTNEILQSTFRSRQQTNSGVTVQNLGAYPSGTVPGYFGGLGTPLWVSHEVGDPAQLTDASIQSYADALLTTLDSMQQDGLLGLLMVNESDAAQTISLPAAAEKLRITWAQLQLPGTGAHTVGVAQAAETDAAQALAKSKAAPLGQASETDSAQALASVKAASLGQAGETDSAQAFARVKAASLGQASETDSAQSISVAGAKTIPLDQAVETDAAQALARAKANAVQATSESDAAQAVSVAKTKAVGQATEADAAQVISISGSKVIDLAQVSESDAAQGIAWNPKIRQLAQVASSDVAQAVSKAKTGGVGLALEIDAANALSRRKLLSLAAATETDEARNIGFAGQKFIDLGMASETDLAQDITRAIFGLGRGRIGRAIAKRATGGIGRNAGATVGSGIGRNPASAATDGIGRNSA